MEDPPRDKGKEKIKNEVEDKYDEETMVLPEFYEDHYNIRVKMQYIFTDIVQYANDFKPNIYSPPVCVKIKGFIGCNGKWTISLDSIMILFRTIRRLFVHSSYGLDKVSNVLTSESGQPTVMFYNEKHHAFNIIVLSPYTSEWPVDTIQVSFIHQKSVKLFDDSTTSKAVDCYNPEKIEKFEKSRDRARKLLERFDKQHETEDIENSLLQQAVKASKEEMKKSEKDAEIENIRKFYKSQLEKKLFQATDEGSYDWFFDKSDDEDENGDLSLS